MRAWTSTSSRTASANLLGLRIHAAAPTTIELFGRVDAVTRDRLAGWLDHRDSTI